MKYLIIGLIIVAAFMLVSYFVAAITKNRKIYAMFRLALLIVEILLVLIWIISFITGMNFYFLLPLILVFGLLIYES